MPALEKFTNRSIGRRREEKNFNLKQASRPWEVAGNKVTVILVKGLSVSNRQSIMLGFLKFEQEIHIPRITQEYSQRTLREMALPFLTENPNWSNFSANKQNLSNTLKFFQSNQTRKFVFWTKFLGISFGYFARV